MPFQEIDRAVCSAPTWPMHQLMVPTPIKPCAIAEQQAADDQNDQAGQRQVCNSVESSVSTPLSTIPDKP